MGILREYLWTFIITSRVIVFRMINISDKVVEKIKTHILYSIFFFFENPTVYVIMW
jgi:hypothetical protein